MIDFSKFQPDVRHNLNHNLLPQEPSDSSRITQIVANKLREGPSSLSDYLPDIDPTEHEQESSIQVALNRAGADTRNDKTKLLALIESCPNHTQFSYHQPNASAVMDRIPKHFHEDREVFSALMHKADIHGYLPVKISDDREFMKSAVLEHGPDYLADTGRLHLLRDEDFALKYIKKYPAHIHDIDNDMAEKNREIAVLVAQDNIDNIKSDSPYFSDKSFYMEVATGHRDALLSDPNRTIHTVKHVHASDFLAHFDPDLRTDKDVVMMEVSINPINLEHAGMQLRNDWDVARLAIETAEELEIPAQLITNRLGNEIRQTITDSGTDAYTYLKKLNFREKLEDSLAGDGNRNGDEEDEPVLKLDRVQSMDEAQARMKASRGRAMGVTQKL